MKFAFCVFEWQLMGFPLVLSLSECCLFSTMKKHVWHANKKIDIYSKRLSYKVATKWVVLRRVSDLILFIERFNKEFESTEDEKKEEEEEEYQWHFRQYFANYLFVCLNYINIYIYGYVEIGIDGFALIIVGFDGVVFLF